MKSDRIAFFVLTLSFLLVSIPWFAHPSTGKDDTGKVSKWQRELPSPNLLARRDWNRNILKPGDQITVIGNRARNRDKGMQVKRLVFADGRELPGTILPPDFSK